MADESLRLSDRVIDEIRWHHKMLKDLPPPAFGVMVDDRVPRTHNQWRSDGRLIIWMPYTTWMTLRAKSEVEAGSLAVHVDRLPFGIPVRITHHPFSIDFET